MRKFTFLVALMMGMAPVFGQITLTQADIGAIGSEYYMGIDTNLGTSFSLGSAGPNVTWDYTMLDGDIPDTVRFLDPASTPYGADFPSATMSIFQVSLDGYAYLESTSSALSILGLAGDPAGLGQTFVITQSDPEQVISFPFTYGDVLEDTSAFSITIPFTQIQGVDSIRLTSNVERNLEADAWGTLQLYGGNYNSLRIKEVRNTNNLIEAHSFLGWLPFQDTTTIDSSYSWWDNTKGYLLCQVSMSDGMPSTADFQDPNIVGAASPTNPMGLQLYPNPVRNELHISMHKPEPVSLQLMDIHGKVVFEKNLSGAHHQVDLPDLSAGMYLYRVLNKRQTPVHHGKLQVTD
jgi:hypothetical protein